MLNQKEASLPNHDPPPDSQTAALVSEHLRRIVATYVRPPPMMAKGQGCYNWDIENRRYLDFSGGIAVNGLGHCDPEVSKLLYQQIHSSPSLLNQQPPNAMFAVTNPNALLKPLPQPLDRRPLLLFNLLYPFLGGHIYHLLRLHFKLRFQNQ